MNLDNSENHADQQIAASFVAALPSKLHRIKAFQDNYLWMLQDPASRLCWVVDPGDAQVIIDTAVSQALELTGILLTHHHADHQGGVEELLVWAARRGIALISTDPVMNEFMLPPRVSVARITWIWVSRRHA